MIDTDWYLLFSNSHAAPITFPEGMVSPQNALNEPDYILKTKLITTKGNWYNQRNNKNRNPPQYMCILQNSVFFAGFKLPTLISSG
jgi:hypothetical protein